MDMHTVCSIIIIFPFFLLIDSPFQWMNKGSLVKKQKLYISAESWIHPKKYKAFGWNLKWAQTWNKNAVMQWTMSVWQWQPATTPYARLQMVAYESTTSTCLHYVTQSLWLNHKTLISHHSISGVMERSGATRTLLLGHSTGHLLFCEKYLHC